ncbi:MAG: hypothetical protein Q8Q31_04490 [Nanoarchaeota archaeon]|nr:hypothetical protein [Nanoarchaeota archaeon]
MREEEFEGLDPRKRNALKKLTDNFLRPEGSYEPSDFQDPLKMRKPFAGALEDERYEKVAASIISLSQERGHWSGLKKEEINPVTAREMASRALLERTEDGSYRLTDLALDWIEQKGYMRKKK